MNTRPVPVVISAASPERDSDEYSASESINNVPIKTHAAPKNANAQRVGDVVTKYTTANAKPNPAIDVRLLLMIRAIAFTAINTAKIIQYLRGMLCAACAHKIRQNAAKNPIVLAVPVIPDRRDPGPYDPLIHSLMRANSGYVKYMAMDIILTAVNALMMDIVMARTDNTDVAQNNSENVAITENTLPNEYAVLGA